MHSRENFARFARLVDREVAVVALRRSEPPALRGLFIAEIAASCALAGAAFTEDDVAALVDRDMPSPRHTLAANVLVADYAAAAHLVQTSPPPRTRVHLTIDEIANLHGLAVRRSLGARPGRWREGTAPALPSGLVPPPAWLVPREVAAFAERIAGGPADGAHPLLWAAEAHARLLRLHPFATANGRTARLVTNLLLRRTGYPPFIVRRRDAASYVEALQRADSRDPWSLALAIARSARATLLTLGRDDPNDPLEPLSTFASGPERAALYKAAQRGRLSTVREGGALLTKRSWIEGYRRR